MEQQNTLKLSELIECPFCGHNETLMIGKPIGEVKYKQKFNGSVSPNNQRLYDNIKFEFTKTYCAGCGRYLGNYKTDKCCQKVKEALGIRKLI